VLLRSNHDTSDNRTLAQRKSRHIWHLILWSGRGEADDWNVASVCHRIDASCDRTCAAVFESVVCAISIGDFQDLPRPLRCGLVVNNMVSAVGLLDQGELLNR
jgi:hypothetical protein